MKKISVLFALALLITMTSCGYEFSQEDIYLSGITSVSESQEAKNTLGTVASKALFKAEREENNPLLTNVFCADPTSVEYDGRLYVYGTRDHQQYLEKGDSGNTYERIKSFVIMSTDDMVNWRYEGMIDTAEIAPWIIASWAPSITSRVEDDGLTHFYLYFSNSGAGVGVLTATDPAGPWTDPLGKPLIYSGMDGLENCPNPFDPGVCIDESGTGWLSFGGGTAPGGSKYMPGSTRIVKLGEDMTSVASDFVEIKAPYFFEASELNYINGTYVYTFNTSWDPRIEWDSKKDGADRPDNCSMCYMTTKTPLDSDSWQFRGQYLKNPGELGMYYSNNHTHLHKYNDTYYLLYHTLLLQSALGIDKGFRSIGVDTVVVNEETVEIAPCSASPKGVQQIKPFNPYQANQAETALLTDAEYKQEKELVTVSCTDGNVTCVKWVDFGKGSKAFAAKVKGSGIIEVRLDSADSEAVTTLNFECSDWTAVYNDAKIEGQHDVFFVYAGSFEFDEWEFVQ